MLALSHLRPQRIRRCLAAGLLVGCVQATPGAAVDTGDPPATTPPPAFTQAELSPPFTHVSAAWAGVALLDYDGDGMLDIFLPNGLHASDALYRNLGDGRFEDVAESAGVDSWGENGGAVAADFDNDGDPDLIVNTVCTTGTWTENGGNLYDGDKIYHENLGDGTFAERSFGIDESSLDVLMACTISMTAADVNNDGWLDLVMSNGHDGDVTPPWIFNKNDPGAENTVLLNDGTGALSTIWRDGGIETTFATAVFDVNNDGKPDLVQAQGGNGVDVCLGDANGDLQRSLASSEAGRGLWMGLAVADLSRDGVLDVYATNQGLSPYLRGYDNTNTFYPGEIVVVYNSDGEPVEQYRPLHPFHAVLPGTGTILDGPADVALTCDDTLAADSFDGMGGRYDHWVPPVDLQRLGWGWGAVALDADADGWMDIAWTGNNGSSPLDIIGDIAHAAGPGGLMLSRGSLDLEDVTLDWGVPNVDEDGEFLDGRGIATGDLNGDGYADFVVANRSTTPSRSNPLAQTGGPPQVWLSAPRDAGWLRVDLQGTQSNRDGLGSTVRVHHADDDVRTYAFGAGGNTCSSSERVLTVGLGDTDAVDVEVRFPSGEVTWAMDVQANQQITVVEPE